MRSGLRSGTGPWGQYKTPDMLGFIRAQRRPARSALFSRVYIIYRTVPNCQASEVAPEPDEKCGAPDKTRGIEYETSVDKNVAGKRVSAVT